MYSEVMQTSFAALHVGECLATHRRAATAAAAGVSYYSLFVVFSAPHFIEVNEIFHHSCLVIALERWGATKSRDGGKRLVFGLTVGCLCASFRN